MLLYNKHYVVLRTLTGYQATLAHDGIVTGHGPTAVDAIDDYIDLSRQVFRSVEWQRGASDSVCACDDGSAL